MPEKIVGKSVEGNKDPAIGVELGYAVEVVIMIQVMVVMELSDIIDVMHVSYQVIGQLITILVDKENFIHDILNL